MKLIKYFNLYYEHGGDNFFLKRVVVGSFPEMVNTWLYYLKSDFKEGNNTKFFEFLNQRFPLPKYYRFDALGEGKRSWCIEYFKLIKREWKELMENPPSFYLPENELYDDEQILLERRRLTFFNVLSNSELPSIFDYLFNIWIEEIDAIHYHYYKQFTYLENYKKVNFLQYLIMKLRGQII